VDDEIRPAVLHEVGHRDVIADVDVVMRERGGQPLQAGDVPQGVAVGAEELAPHVVVDAIDRSP